LIFKRLETPSDGTGALGQASVMAGRSQNSLSALDARRALRLLNAAG
jgi:hypothetical protein